MLDGNEEVLTVGFKVGSNVNVGLDDGRKLGLTEGGDVGFAVKDGEAVGGRTSKTRSDPVDFP